MFFRTPHDRECTVVLLDSERIDAVMGEGLDTRHDLSGLECPSPRTSDVRGGEICGGGRESIN